MLGADQDRQGVRQGSGGVAAAVPGDHNLLWALGQRRRRTRSEGQNRSSGLEDHTLRDVELTVGAIDQWQQAKIIGPGDLGDLAGDIIVICFGGDGVLVDPRVPRPADKMPQHVLTGLAAARLLGGGHGAQPDQVVGQAIAMNGDLDLEGQAGDLVAKAGGQQDGFLDHGLRRGRRIGVDMQQQVTEGHLDNSGFWLDQRCHRAARVPVGRYRRQRNVGGEQVTGLA
ncbi:MAG: hypothetical protein H7236_05730 [Gemmatimonadaceae bacterium]|nr:hypothetical protein [Caulobacter sp.]